MPHGYPSNPEIEQEFIDLLYTNGGTDHQMQLSDVYSALANCFNLTEPQRIATCIEVTGRGEPRPYWENLVRTAKARLIAKGVLRSSSGHGLCRLQDLSKVTVHVRKAKKPLPQIKDAQPVVYQYLTEDTPQAVDIKDVSSAARAITTTYRILRDTATALRIKAVYEYRCQICTDRITIGTDRYYAEVHHIKPLGEPHNGPDVPENIVCVCPNHHVELDYGAIRLDLSRITLVEGHAIGLEYLEYHNHNIFGYGNRFAPHAD